MEVRRLLPPRWWWLTLGVILFVAGALRFTGYNFSLPYVDHPDEPAYNISGRMILDSGSAKPLGMQGYPPGIITVNYFFERLFQDPTAPATTVIWMVRLVSISFSLATVAAIALLAFRVATPLAGLLAAGLWTVTPSVVEFSRYATADNFVTFFSVFAIFLVLTGTRFNRRHWIYAAVISEILAILFKYQAMFILPLIVAVPLWRLTDSQIPRRTVLREFVITSGVLAVFFFWLIFLFPALEANQAPYWSAPSERFGIPSPAVLGWNFQILYRYLEPTIIWLIGWLGWIAFAWRAFRRRIDLLAFIVVAAMFAGWLVGVSLYGSLDAQEFRQFIAAGACLYVLHAVGIVGWIFLLETAVRRFMQVRLRQALAFAVVSIAVLTFALPNLQASIANAVNHTLPDRRNALADWMDISQQPGAYIAGTENHKTFNREWGGYGGINQFPLYQVARLSDRSIEDWRADGVDYAIISTDEYEALQSTPEGQAELAQTLLLKSYPPSPDYRGPDMVVLRLYPIQHQADDQLDGQLGSIHLVGYDLNTSDPSSGDTLDFTLYWRADQPTYAVPYVVYNHLIDAETGDVVAQVDGDPLPDLRRPTITWNDPAEILVSRPFSMPLTDVPPGTYQLVTGFYDRDTGVRLLSPDGADSLTVATIHLH